MNYIITGSLGHTGRPITEGLVNAGHTVTVITSKAETAREIEALGANAAVGSLEDAEFVKETFADADAVYLMIPPTWNPTNWRAWQNAIADTYVEAIKANDIRFAVVLSSIGAHRSDGVGPVKGLHDLEEKLKGINALNVKFLRPAYFMQNFMSLVPMVKQTGILGGNFGNPDEKVALAHPDDIAQVALHELLNLDFTGKRVRYVVGDERTGEEIARVLGAAIGKPETPWVVFSDEQDLQGMMQAGLNQEIARNYNEMGAAMRTGIMQEDYWLHRTTLEKTKLEDFARNEFAPAFNT
ncbi:NmrA family NAD(P)-binding protein [Nibrella saemangeumensis]|uniref:NmrA family NAD(P)-binding protein n=1 Tax=Nibrella saemangeumensis TaxID=1084526 RepID=A0ABP8MN25_9BACT